jgi:hypothetical protein
MFSAIAYICAPNFLYFEGGLEFDQVSRWIFDFIATKQSTTAQQCGHKRQAYKPHEQESKM